MKDKKARKEIDDLRQDVKELKEAIKKHRHELNNGLVYMEYV